MMTTIKAYARGLPESWQRALGDGAWMDTVVLVPEVAYRRWKRRVGRPGVVLDVDATPREREAYMADLDALPLVAIHELSIGRRRVQYAAGQLLVLGEESRVVFGVAFRGDLMGSRILTRKSGVCIP